MIYYIFTCGMEEFTHDGILGQQLTLRRKMRPNKGNIDTKESLKQAQRCDARSHDLAELNLSLQT